MLRGAPHPQRVVSLLDADAEIAERVPAAELGSARRRACALRVALARGDWDPADLCARAGAGWLGLFVVKGVLVRSVSIASRTSCELIACGDVVRPWDDEPGYDPLGVAVGWRVLEPAVIAVLDDQFALRVARWPTIAAALLERSGGAVRRLAIGRAMSQLPRTHERLLLMFWILADRWGKVGPEGVSIRLPLTHQLLAALIGNQRPSVTIAIQRLARRGLLVRQSADEWLLTTKATDLLGREEGIAAALSSA